MLMFDKWHILSDFWSDFNCIVIGWSIGGIISNRKCIKDLKKMQKLSDEHFLQVVRTADFQLRAKGCEGMTKELEELKVFVEKTEKLE